MKQIAPLKILKASAGSGKTFSLTLHYITLLLTNENNYREILAVTFTNKATAEMKERILTVLSGLALDDNSSRTNDFRQLLLNQFPDWNAALIQEKAYHIFRKILHDYSHFTVSTIDGFSQKVIRGFTYELNLDAAYKIEMNTNKVKQDLTVMLNQLLDERPDLLDWIINYAEKKIANNENWNYRRQLMELASLIFTENFQEFDAHLASADAQDIFLLLNQEVEEKTNLFLQSLSEAIKTFQHTFKNLGITANDLKGKSRNALISADNSDSNVSKLSPSDLQKLFDKFLKLIESDDAFTDTDKNIRYDLKAQLMPILQQIEDLHRFFPTYIAYQAVQNNLYFLRLLKEMSSLLAQWRKENGAQLISDSQILLNKLGLDENNDPTFIWEKIGNRYSYFLFDEFQDTSRIQWKNYSPLLINALGNAQRKFHEHLIVGDVKQSIYRWRNGDWRILLQQVEEQVAQAFHLSPDQRQYFIENGSLDVNYRSLPRIITFNNHLFAQLPQKLQQLLNDKVQESLSEEAWQWWTASGNHQMLNQAYAQSQQEIPLHKINAPKQGSIEIEYLPVEDNRYRRQKVMDEALERLCNKIEIWISSKRYEPRQIGILVRSNTQAKAVIQKLLEHKNKTGLAIEVISGDALALLSNDAILLLIETLKALVYHADKHILHRAKITYLYQLISQKKSFSEDKWLLFKNNTLQDLQEILPEKLISVWNELQKAPLVHLVEQLIEIYDLHHEKNIHLPYILAFKDIVSNFSLQGERGITQFLEFWEEDGNKAVLPSNGRINAIEVTTIHKSKGLAYDVVMLPFCSWDLDGMTNGDFWINTHDSPFQQLGRIPIKYNSTVGKSIFFKQYFEEMLFNYMDALNTFYVATTRAVEHLYILAPSFKEKTDAKTGIASLEIKNDYISDVLYQVLSSDDAPFRLQQGTMCIEDESTTVAPSVEATSQKAEAEQGRIHFQNTTLAHYPISHELQKALDKSTKRTINSILMLEKAAQYGILAHEIISMVTKEHEIDPYVHQFIEEGILAKSDQPFLMQEIHQIWNHPVINSWLTGPYKIWNESSIILQDGETIRPDKVFTNEKETIVLDFKFTKGDYTDHQYQIDRYKKALVNLGHPDVKGYLYYAKIDELVEVE